MTERNPRGMTKRQCRGEVPSPSSDSDPETRALAALSALLDDDTAVAWEIVRMMQPTELDALALACRKIEAMCENAALRLVEATLRGRPRSHDDD